MTWPIWEPYFHRFIDHMVEQSRVVIACDADDEDFIFGYLVWQWDALIWAYVKPPYRQERIFTQMLESTDLPKDLRGCQVVCCSNRWFKRLELNDDKLGVIRPGRKGLGDKYTAVYNPFRMFQ